MAFNQRVSIITPTTNNRDSYNTRIIQIAQAQTYPIHEHLFDFGSGTIGTKRNRLCHAATGDIIVHFDSDDYYAPNWISRIVQIMQHHPEYDIYGLKDLYYSTGYKYTGGRPNGIVWGATMAYRRDFWQRHRFADKQIGEDSLFCQNARVMSMTYVDGFLAGMHDDNTSKKNISGERWNKVILPSALCNAAEIAL